MPSNFEKLRRYILPYRGVIYLGLACLLLTNLCQVAIPLLMKNAIDDLQAQAGTKLLLQAVLFIAGLAVLQASFRTLSRMFILNASRHLEYKLRSEVFDHVQKLSPHYFQKTTTGQVMALLTNDITFVRLLYGVGTLQFTNAFICYCFTLAAVMSINWKLAILITITFPIVFLICRRTVFKIFVQSKANQEIFGAMSDRLNESFAGVRTLKGYNAHAYREDVFAKSSYDYYLSSLRLTNLRLFFSEFMDAGLGMGMVMILGYGGVLVASHTMSLGELVAFSAYLAILAWPTQMMGWVVPASQRGWSAFVRLQEILQMPIEAVYDSQRRAHDPNWQGDLVFHNVDFAYPNSQNVLHDINLTIKQSSKVLITGPVASGKTTLLKLMSGLYLPSSGKLTVGGVQLTDDNLHQQRQWSSYCPQDATIFSKSLAANIQFAPNNQTDLVTAASLAQLDLDPELFPEGWQTMVGERGVTLSGGQRQRTALARAISKQHRWLLLDDPIAQLDGRTALALWQALLTKLTQSTIVLVSQRLLLPESFDTIIVMHQGRIIEHGKHATLIKHKGLYQHLFELQKIMADDLLTVQP